MKVALFSFLIIASLAPMMGQPIYNLSGTLSGLNEAPTNGSTASGTISGTYDQNTGIITMNTTFTGLAATATAAHIHNAPAGINGAIIVTLTIGAVTSGSIVGNYVLPFVNEAAFLAGDTYVNIHNATFPGGEIRAQVTATLAAAPIPTLGGWAFIVLIVLISIFGVLSRKEIAVLSTIDR